jgi:hypothetical protein
MIPSIIAIELAFYWLLRETNYLRVRLPYGKSISRGIETPSGSLPLPEPITSPAIASPPILLLTEQCSLTKIHEILGKSARSYGYHGGYNVTDKTSYQTMTIGNQTVTLNATLPNLYELIAECSKVQTEKPRKPSVKPCQLAMDAFIGQVRVGSHSETREFRGHKYSALVDDYTTHFHDCLPGKDWLEAHYKDEYPEPTIELAVDGKTLSLNGNFKKGMIKEFMSEYTTKTRVKTTKIDIADKVEA